MRLHPGGVPDGLRLLRVHFRGEGAGSDAGGDIGAGDLHPGRQRRARVQHRPHGDRGAHGQPGQRAAVSGAGEPPAGAEHRDAAHQPLHLRRHPRHTALGGAGAAADAVGVPPRAGQRDPQPDHAGEPGLRCGRAVRRLSRLLQEDGPPYQL